MIIKLLVTEGSSFAEKIVVILLIKGHSWFILKKGNK